MGMSVRMDGEPGWRKTVWKWKIWVLLAPKFFLKWCFSLNAVRCESPDSPETPERLSLEQWWDSRKWYITRFVCVVLFFFFMSRAVSAFWCSHCPRSGQVQTWSPWGQRDLSPATPPHPPLPPLCTVTRPEQTRLFISAARHSLPFVRAVNWLFWRSLLPVSCAAVVAKPGQAADEPL